MFYWIGHLKTGQWEREWDDMQQSAMGRNWTRGRCREDRAARAPHDSNLLNDIFKISAWAIYTLIIFFQFIVLGLFLIVISLINKLLLIVSPKLAFFYSSTQEWKTHKRQSQHFCHVGACHCVVLMEINTSYSIFCLYHNIFQPFLFRVIATTDIYCVWKYTVPELKPGKLLYNDKKICLGVTLFWYKVIHFDLIGHFLSKPIFRSFWSVWFSDTQKACGSNK